MSKTQIVMSGLFFMVILAFMAVLRLSQPSEPLPIFSTISEYELTDSQGQIFNSNQMRDKIWVADFFFTTCQGICPKLSAEMLKIQKRFSEKNKNVELVSISIDPETDTPKKLASYAAKFKAKPGVWHFLTGNKQRIKEIVVKEFKIGFADEPLYHSDRFVLIDEQARIRGYYSLTDEGAMDKLHADISQLLKQK